MELVESGKDWIFCDSGMVSRKFGVKHADVVRTMKTLIPKLKDFSAAGCDTKNSGISPKFKTEGRSYRGKNYTAYLMNRDCFMLLGMRFDTKRARKWQGQFLAAFKIMENQLSQSIENKFDKAFLGNRTQLKIGRKEETDVIEEFVEYCMERGSENANRYYKHVTNATYRALGLMAQKKPKLRDAMNMYEMAQLLLAEQVAKQSLRKYMDLGREYHDIYDSVRDDLIAFADGMRIE